MARALLAKSPDGRDVVLKIPLEPTALMVTRLRDEAQAGMRIDHPNVVRTIDWFVDDGHAVLVVEYIDGCALRDLRQLRGKPNPLPAVAVASIGRSIAEGLRAIHGAVDDDGRPLGMLHRDVTPSNILLGRDGVPRLIDLGIARSAENEAEQTRQGMIKGTLRYVAPELLNGGGYSPATDLWSLGCCLFEAALGRMLVRGDPVAIFKAIVTGSARQLRAGEAIDPDLQAAIFALLAPEDERLRNAGAAAAIFARLEQTLIAKDPDGYTGRQWLQSWVPWASPIDGDDDVDVDAPLLPPASPARIVIGLEQDGSAATMQMPAVDVAPVAAVSTWMSSQPAITGKSLTDTDSGPSSPARRDVLALGALTMQMPGWREPDAAVDVDLGSLDGPPRVPPAGSWDDDTAPNAASPAPRAVSLEPPTEPNAAPEQSQPVPVSAQAAPTMQLPIAGIDAAAAQHKARMPMPWSHAPGLAARDDED